MGEWKPDKLGSYLKFKNGKTSPLRDDGGAFPVFGSNGIIGYSRETNSPSGTIIVGRVGTYCGSLHFSETPCWVTDNAIVCRPPEREEKFWFYALSSLDLNNYRAGSGQPLLNQTILKQIDFITPSENDRIQIGKTLSALDDKIALNRRMNETLERQARALFKDWFVHFGPTRAKAGGAKPTLPPEIWPLFPDRLDDNGVPEGWEEKCVRDILELSYGKSLPAKKRISGEIPVYGSGGITGAHNEALVTEPTIIVGRKGTVGSLYWQPTPCFPIDTVFYVKTDQSLVFCYYLLQTLGLNTMNTDAAVPGLNRDNAYRLPVMWANKPVRDAFDSLVIPLRERIDANNRESRTLAQTRDLLLPKLMSGALRVGAAEKIVEGAL